MSNNNIIYEIYMCGKTNEEQELLFTNIYVDTIEKAKHTALKLSLYYNKPFSYKEVKPIGNYDEYIKEDRLLIRATLGYSNTIQDNGTNFYIKKIVIEPYIMYARRIELNINESISTKHEYLVTYPYKNKSNDINPAELLFVYRYDNRLETYDDVMKEAYIYADFFFSVLIRNDKPFKEFINTCKKEYSKN